MTPRRPNNDGTRVVGFLESLNLCAVQCTELMRFNLIRAKFLASFPLFWQFKSKLKKIIMKTILSRQMFYSILSDYSVTKLF